MSILLAAVLLPLMLSGAPDCTEPDVWVCPHCGASDYTVGVIGVTGAYYPPRIVDGVNVNPDRNTIREPRQCNQCGEWTVVEYIRGEQP